MPETSEFPIATLGLPEDEQQRLAAIRALKLLDTDPDPEFDEIVELATHICGAPIGLMSLVDENRVFHKARVGLDLLEAPRSLSICDYTIRQDDVLIVEDTSVDPRFSANPFVTAVGGVRFYAGAPLQAPTGEKVGSLCVVDTTPRHLTNVQIRSLQTLAKQIAVNLALRAEKEALQKMTAVLRESDRMFRGFIDALPVEAHLKDEEGRILFYNKRLADRFGVSMEEWLGKTSRELWSEKTAGKIMREDASVLLEGRTVESYVETPGPDQETIYWKTIKVPFVRPDGRGMVAAIAMDVTADTMHQRQLEQIRSDLELANRKLETQALTDELTKLSNRRAFEGRLQELIALARRSGLPLSLLLIDVDNFKMLNDTHGHRSGDEVLRIAGHLLASVKRIPDVAARYGGEEFAVLLPQTSAVGAVKLAERILEVVRSYSWEPMSVTVSIGCAELSAEMSADDFVRAADEALYQSKHAGKDRATLFPNAD